MNKKAWLEWRQEGLGASDAPVLLGISPYTTLYQLWEEKVFGKKETSNYAMERGKKIEPLALRFFREDQAIDLEEQVLATHSEHWWMRATLDGYNKENGIVVEAKSCINLPEKPREDHIAQVQWQMEVMEVDFAYLVYHNEQDGIIFRLDKDNEMVALLIEKGKKFMEMVENLQEPPLSDRDYVNMEGVEEWKILAYRYGHLKQRMKELQEVETFLKTQFILHADGKRAQGYGVKLNHVTRKGSVDYNTIPAVAQMNEEELNKYRKDPIQYWSPSVDAKYFDNIEFSKQDEENLALHAELA